MRPRQAIDLSMRHLQAITALARCGKFVAAASEIGISQPTLSRLIQQAERELGAELFSRGTRRVFQTAAGRAFIPTAERILSELVQQSRAVRNIDGEMRGQLIVASLMSISHHVVPAALVAYRRRYPKMFVQIRDGIASSVLEDVRTGIVDFGIGSPPEKHFEIAVQSVVEEPCYVLLPRKHRLAGEAGIRLRDLADEPMISMPTDSGLRRLIDGAAHRQSLDLNHTIITSQFPSLCEFVAKGLGVSIVPASAVPPSYASALSARPLRPILRRRVGIFHLAERPLSPSSSAFLDIFRPMFLAAIRGVR